MFALFIHHLSKIADWQSKARKFLKILTRERSKSYYEKIIIGTCSKMPQSFLPKVFRQSENDPKILVLK